MFRFIAKAPEFVVEPIDSRDVGQLAEIHPEGFAKPWSAEELEALLAQPGVFGFAAWPLGNRRAGPAGFVMARAAADEGEILTLVVSRARRKLGLGRELMEAVLRELHARRATALFLEVDEHNQGGLALYRRLHFREVGRRPGYYQHPTAPRTTAIVMRRDLVRPAPPDETKSAVPR